MKSLRKMTKAQLIARLQSLENFEGMSSEASTIHDAHDRFHSETSISEGPEERLRAILQTAVEGIITIDEFGIIESMNPAAEKIFGYRADELKGRRVNVLMPSPFREEHDDYLRNYVSTGRAKIIGIGREVAGKRKDGRVFPLHLAVSEVKLRTRRIFTGFIRDISEQKLLENELLNVSENEQRRIGQDLHDGLCQQLAGIEFMSRALERRLAVKSPTEADAASNISRLLREAILHTRNLARGLSPVILEPQGLMDALKLMADNIRSLFSVNCEFICDKRVLLKDNTVAVHLFRIAQEAVNNAIRHGKAKRVILHLSATDDEITLTVHDDGRGMPNPPGQRKGMGLRIMRYRAGIIGGSLTLHQGTRGGTVVVCSLPRAPKYAQASPRYETI